MGEYDSVTGLTYVTRQRGRLHFNMGANAIKQAHAAAGAEARAQREQQQDRGCRIASSDSQSAVAATKDLLALRLRTGAFTGLALYPEEAYYLLQRGALVIFQMEQQSSRDNTLSHGDGGHHRPQQLSIVRFAALVLRHQRASLACLDVYAFLKEHKFHPRRHREEIMSADAARGELSKSTEVATRMPLQDASLGLPAYSQPQHYCADTDQPCQFAYDVWKSTTETLYIPNEDHKPPLDDSTSSLNNSATGQLQAEEPKGAPPEQPPLLRPSTSFSYVRRKKDTSTKKRKIKRLRLVFRVVVCRFADAMPPPVSLASLVATSGSQPSAGDGAHVPVKVAVVDQDKSVLFFEVG